jgi:ribosomal protein L32/head-tail adaptor
MSKGRKGKRVMAAAMAVVLSVATVTTGVLPNTAVYVHAEESDRMWTKLADSSVDGFYYREDQYGNIECVTDKTCVYTSYDQMVKEIASIAKRIFLENKYAKYDFDIPVEIKSDHTIEEIENGKCDKDIRNEIYKDTGKPNEGHTMSAFTVGGGNLLAENCSDGIKYSDGGYKGYYSGNGGYGDRRDRYQKATKKLDEVIKSLNLDGKSDYDKFKAVTNWIVSNVRYDEDNETKYQHDLTGVVLDGLAVCDGYAGTFYYMANAVGLNALFEDGITNSNRIRHAWNLVQIDGTYYYVDPTNAYFKEDGEPGRELLLGQKYLFSLYTPDNTTIEDTYKNISQDDYLKEHSICKGNHDLWESGHNGATCENPATTVYSCKNKGCLYKKYVETAPALGHEWGNAKITQEQSCENPEITTYTCTHSLCGRKKQVETKPALGHTWDEGKVTKEATCSETGVKTHTCTRCGGTKNEEIPKTKHDYEEHVETPATCTSRGVSYYVCKNCGLTTSKKQTPATGHIHTEVRNKKDATYTDDGYTGDTYCKDCSKKLETGTMIPKLVEKEHDYGEWVLDQAPTCKKYGVRHRICKNCGDREVDVLDKVDHSWELVSTTPATCTIGEIQHYKCSVCGETKDVTLSNPLGEHSWDNGKVTKEATETEEGVKTYTCKTCGETKTEKIPVTSHHLDQGTITKKATCTENGEKTYHCTDADCDKTYVETIPATGHKFDSWKTVKAQSIYSGAVQKRTCNACGKKETRIVGDKLKPVLKVNAPKLQLKRRQKTQKFTLTDIAKGDSVKSWVSSNKKIVTVSGKPNGACIIKAGKKTGSAKITITMRSNLKKTIGVKVQKKAVACTFIKNVPKKLTLKSKRSYQLKPVINPITCTYKAKYKTSNKKIVKVTSKGKITAVKKGKAKITVMVGKKKFGCMVTFDNIKKTTHNKARK